MAEGGAKGDEAGQVLVFGAQAVHDPRSEAGADEGVRAGVQLQQRSAMGGVVRVNGADDAEVIRAGADFREEVAHLNAALAVLLELPRRAEQVPGAGELDARLLERVRLAAVPGEQRLRIERVHL